MYAEPAGVADRAFSPKPADVRRHRRVHGGSLALGFATRVPVAAARMFSRGFGSCCGIRAWPSRQPQSRRRRKSYPGTWRQPDGAARLQPRPEPDRASLRQARTTPALSRTTDPASVVAHDRTLPQPFQPTRVQPPHQPRLQTLNGKTLSQAEQGFKGRPPFSRAWRSIPVTLASQTPASPAPAAVAPPGRSRTAGTAWPRRRCPCRMRRRPARMAAPS